MFCKRWLFLLTMLIWIKYIYSVEQQRHPVFTEGTFSHPVKGKDLRYIAPCVERHVSLDMKGFCSSGSVKEQANARDHINFTFSTIYCNMWVFAITFIFIWSFMTVSCVHFNLRHCYCVYGAVLFCFFT